METAKIKELVSKMTLEEKASLCSGLDFWHTKRSGTSRNPFGNGIRRTSRTPQAGR